MNQYCNCGNASCFYEVTERLKAENAKLRQFIQQLIDGRPFSEHWARETLRAGEAGEP